MGKGITKFLKKHPGTKPQYAPFDWIMSLPVIRIFAPIYEWNRGFWIYCFLGFMSVVADFVTSAIIKPFIPSATLITAIAFAVSTLASFVMFRYLYFDRTNNSFINELLKFIPTRLFTFFFEIFFQRLKNIQVAQRGLFSIVLINGVDVFLFLLLKFF